MSQLFHPSTNSIAKTSVFGLSLLLIATGLGLVAFVRSDYYLSTNNPITQPVPFSHQRHVGANGIQCVYCHTSVEDSAFAGLPATETCMTCHSQILADSPLLEPVRRSWETGQPIEWVRVHDLPDYVYINHSVHINKGIGCETCHGPVNEMRLTQKEHTLQMEWCLECHRAPEKFIRPREEIYTFDWQPSENQLALGQRLVAEYQVNTEQLTDCSMCHR